MLPYVGKRCYLNSGSVHKEGMHPLTIVDVRKEASDHTSAICP
jgi:hypothetical protein